MLPNLKPLACGHWVTPFLIAALIAGGGCATIRKFNPLESKTLESRRLTQEAEAAIYESNLDHAEAKLITAIERDPADSHARSVLADVLWQRSEPSAAIEQMAKSIQLSGRRDPQQVTSLGQMLLTTGDNQSALLRADEAIAVDPMLADAWTLKGFALKNQGKPEEALSAFFRSLSIRNDDPQTRLEIATIYHQTEQSQRALSILGAPHVQSPESCPHYAEACYLRGLLLRDLDRPADAIVALRDARAAGYQNTALLFALADLQINVGEMLQARATVKDASAMVGAEHHPKLAELKQRLDTQAPSRLWR